MPPETPTILAFDTAAAHCAAAVMLNGQLVAETVEPMKTGQAERLMVLLEEMLAAQGLGWADLDGIAVGIGPGNFTGIRLGVAAARGLSLALGIPAVGISALEMRAGLAGESTVTLPAGRGHAYQQRFSDAQAVSAIEMIKAQTPPAEITPNLALMARLAAARLADTHRPPAPIYMRAADAAPGADAPPRMLDAR